MWNLSLGHMAPECVDSVVVARDLSFPMACGILVPWPGIELMSPALQGRFSATGPPGKVPQVHFLHCWLCTASQELLQHSQESEPGFGAWVSCPALYRDCLCSWVGVHCEVCRSTGSAQCSLDPWGLVSSFSLPG